MISFSLCVISIGILILGTVCFLYLVNSYGDKLLINFAQKIWMTFWLGIVFASIFILANYVMAKLLDPQKIIANMRDYAGQPGFLFRMGLAYFVLNACLIMAFRSMIKALYLFWKVRS